MVRGRKTARKPRRKAIKVQLIPKPERRSKDPTCPYFHLDKMLAHHQHLDEAKIAIAWMLDVKANVDGFLVLGKCKKQTDLDREMREFDFVIFLNATTWKQFDEKQRAALMDHELCHAGVAEDKKTGDPVLDEKGRRVYRTKKHDVEEFESVIRRHGLYKRDLQTFAKACAEGPLFKDLPEQPAPSKNPNEQQIPKDESKAPSSNGKINGHVNGHTNNICDKWRIIPLREALPDMPKKFYELCENQDIDTIGKLTDWKNEKPDRWWKDLGKGVGPATFDQLDDGIEEFFAKHPVES